MKASIVCIGSEINLGLIINTNATYIAQKLSEIGIESNIIISVKDLKSDIKEATGFCIDHSDIIILSGGLGPTEDDLTRDAVADLLDLKLIKNDLLDDKSLRFIRKEISQKLKKKLLKQSYIPEGARPIIPNIGSASGFEVFLRERNKWLFSIPGVPKEMKDMIDNSVIKRIKDILDSSKENNEKILKKVLLTTGISESEIEEKIPDIYKTAARMGVEIGITASPGIIRLIIVSKSLSDKTNNENADRIKSMLVERLDEFIYGEENKLISESLKETIMKSGKAITISAAESMTGGLISQMITDVSGSSQYFKGAVISYSDFSKIKILGIEKKLLKQYGAVSEQVCREMALNVKKIFDSDYSVSISGFAGPEADNNIDNVGLTYIGIAMPDEEIKVFRLKFIGTRTEIKYRASQFALNKLRLQIHKSN
ncbi:MAG TPA: CinA family nicotinamide mononucleotide deamidase-related protein [Actinobacteria bacterium]|jgi:nicotinamide-nucleotide amidase|nr:CinA family nicotinamide mononucleotide deamidase-related protein [Actinomycetota bacterium]